MKRVLPGILAVALPSASMAQLAPLEPRTGSSWTLTGQDAKCILSRQFVAANRDVTITFDQLPFDENPILVVATNDRRANSGWSDATMSTLTGPDIKSRVQWLDTVGNNRIGRFWLSRTDLEQIAKSKRLTITNGNWTESFDLPNIQSALGALKSCEKEVFAFVARGVGLADDEIEGVASYPLMPPILRRWPKDFTEAQAGRDVNDEAVAAYIVGADGKIDGCAIVHRAKDSMLSDRSCRDWGPLRFKPARDQSNRAIRGIYFMRERWYIP